MKAIFSYQVSYALQDRLLETRAIQSRFFPDAMAGHRTIEIHGGDGSPKDFCMAALLNGAISRAVAERADWLVLLDVDALLIHTITQWPDTGFSLIFKRNMDPGEGFDPLPSVFTHSSYFVLHRDVFTAHRFCEDYRGYGHEDWDYMETLRKNDIRIRETDGRMMHRWHPPRPWIEYQEANRKLYFERTGLVSPREQ